MNDRLIPEGHPASLENLAPPPSAPLDALIDAGLARLKETMPPRVIVDLFPDKPDEYDFEGYDAAALIIYEGSRFDQAGQRGAQGLVETVRVTVVLLVRSLKGRSGATQLLANIRQALHGQSLAGSTGLRPLEAELDRESAGVFQYRFSFECSLVAIPVKTSGLALPRGFSTERR